MCVKRRTYFLSIFCMVVMGLLQQSCISDDVSECHYDGGLRINVRYVPEEGDVTTYAERIRRLNFYLFRADGTFYMSHSEKIPVQLASDNYSVLFYVPPGEYRCVVWADNTENDQAFYTVSPFESGVTVDADAILSVHREKNNTVPFASNELLYGALGNLEMKLGIFNEYEISLENNVNRLELNVYGIPDGYDASSLASTVDLRNADYKFDNSIVETSPLLHYTPVYEPHTNPDFGAGISCLFRFFKLENEMQSRIVITAERNGVRSAFFDLNLINLLLASPKIDFSKNHSFKLDIHFKGAVVTIAVNDWILSESVQPVE